MTSFSSHRLLAFAALGLAGAWPLAPHCAAAEAVAQLEVLDLDEAAALLRVKPDVLAELALAQRVPSRRVGDVWRFSRSALLQWLAVGQGTVALDAAAATLPTSGPGARAPLLDVDLSTLRARGTVPSPTLMAQAPTEPRPTLNPAPPHTVGEAPTAPTAEEVALRDQRVLLKRGALTMDVGVSYAYSEQSFFPFIRQERRSVGLNTALRYGLFTDVQATLRLPAVSSRIKTFSLGTAGGPSTQGTSSDTYFGDASLSLRGVAQREGVGRPNIIWSVDTVVPSGPGDRGFGGGVVVSKSYDPAVIFAGLSVLRGLKLDPADTRRSLPERSVGLSMGYTYAVNDALALSSVFSGSFRSTTTPTDGSFPPPRDRYQLQLGMTWLLARGLFMEPAVAMRLGGESPDVSISVNVAHTF